MNQVIDLINRANQQDVTAFQALKVLSKIHTSNTLILTAVGNCYEHGLAVKQDLHKAADFYQRAAEVGGDVAMTHLGRLYARQNTDGPKYNLATAAHWFLLAAKKNTQHPYGSDLALKELRELAYKHPSEPTVLTNLGICYEFGYGGMKDTQQALVYYRKAAKLNHDVALCNLGRAYETGNGVEVNLMQAAKYYLASIQQQSMNPKGSLLAAEKLANLKLTNKIKFALSNLEAVINAKQDWKIIDFLGREKPGFPIGISEIKRKLAHKNRQSITGLYTTYFEVISLLTSKQTDKKHRHLSAKIFYKQSLTNLLHLTPVYNDEIAATPSVQFALRHSRQTLRRS